MAVRMAASCRASRTNTTRKSRMMASSRRRRPSAPLAGPRWACSAHTFSASPCPSTRRRSVGAQCLDASSGGARQSLLQREPQRRGAGFVIAAKLSKQLDDRLALGPRRQRAARHRPRAHARSAVWPPLSPRGSACRSSPVLWDDHRAAACATSSARARRFADTGSAVFSSWANSDTRHSSSSQRSSSPGFVTRARCRPH